MNNFFIEYFISHYLSSFISKQKHTPTGFFNTVVLTQKLIFCKLNNLTFAILSYRQ